MKRLAAILLTLLLFPGCMQRNAETPAEQQTTISQTSETHPAAVLPSETQSTEPFVTDVPEVTAQEPVMPNGNHFTDFKGIWLSQYDLAGIYLNQNVQREKSDFINRMSEVLDNVQAQGFNTVVLQVRPNGDSMYPSEYYPMSRYVVGTYGLAADYDPVSVIVELAKARNLSIHAWINPMRCMSTENLEKISIDYLIRQWYDDPMKNGTYIVSSGAYWYLNPAYEEVRKLITDGAAEILARYDFDGLHMDDYFYPTTDASFDAAAYAEMGSGMSLEEFRRNNLNMLVASLYEITKASGQEKEYGISPAGNIDTVYQQQYADVYTWCSEEGYIDYICPQVYFGLEHQRYDFISVCNTWQDIIRLDAVDLVVGMTFEKALRKEDPYAGSGKNEWNEHTDVLQRCLEYTSELQKCRGICVFSYQHFYDPISGEEIAGTSAERDAFVPAMKNITWIYRGGVG